MSGSAPVTRVLAIDDSEDIHAILRARLEREGLVLESAASGAEGLAAVLADPPALILLDLGLPGMDGFEVLRHLKDNDRTHSIPVIVLSGSDDAKDKVRGLDMGAVDYVCKPFDHYELSARLRVALRTQRLLEMLARRAQIDGLTGLWNREHFDARLADALATSARHGAPLALAYGDLDHFKSVNDTYGHSAGDAVLEGFADILLGELREADVAFRLGGEEFALLLPDTTVEESIAVLERIRASLAGVCWPRHPDRAITCSFGVADRGVGGSWEPSAWMEAADKALYAAKNAGRDRVMIAHGEEIEPAPC